MYILYVYIIYIYICMYVFQELYYICIGPYFQFHIMMKLEDGRQLEFYENNVDKKGYDTINCPEYLKKHLNTLS